MFSELRALEVELVLEEEEAKNCIMYAVWFRILRLYINTTRIRYYLTRNAAMTEPLTRLSGQCTQFNVIANPPTTTCTPQSW